MTRRFEGRTRRFVPPDPPRTPKAKDTRTRVLRCAADLFVERGYEAVSMRDIATEAELTHGGLYGHVRSKGQLLVEVLRWEIAEREASEAFASAVDDPDRSPSLLADPSGQRIRLLSVDAAAAARHDDEVAAGFAELLEERRAVIRELVADDVDDPDAAAFAISIVENGIAVYDAAGVLGASEHLLPIVYRMLESMATERQAERPGDSVPSPA